MAQDIKFCFSGSFGLDLNSGSTFAIIPEYGTATPSGSITSASLANCVNVEFSDEGITEAVFQVENGDCSGSIFTATWLPLPVPPPTAAPTVAPTVAPTTAPTSAPTGAPTTSPTPSPTAAPVNTPTPPPTAPPTPSPTTAPTTSPTPSPTAAPAPGATPPPTTAPTPPPTTAPTSPPTAAPTTTAPTAAPTPPPTAAPTTTAPTAAPTDAPTGAPTTAPTAAPTGAPTSAPVQPCFQIGIYQDTAAPYGCCGEPQYTEKNGYFNASTLASATRYYTGIGCLTLMSGTKYVVDSADTSVFYTFVNGVKTGGASTCTATILSECE